MGLFSKKDKSTMSEDFDMRMQEGFKAEQERKANKLAYLQKLTKPNDSVHEEKNGETVLNPEDKVR